MDMKSQMVEDLPVGLTTKQWTLLLFAFLLGIASVFTLDKTILARDTTASSTVQAATHTP